MSNPGLGIIRIQYNGSILSQHHIFDISRVNLYR